jgi:hypothetical protein
LNHAEICILLFGGLSLKIKSDLTTAEPEEKRLLALTFVKSQTAFHFTGEGH